VDICDLPTLYICGLALSQKHIKCILAEWAGDLGILIYR